MKIPLFSGEHFFKIAIGIAKDENVTNSEEFTRRFKKDAEQLQNEWENSFDEVFSHLERRVFHYELDKPYSPTQDAWKSIYDVYDDRSYVNFLQLLRGITVGWRPDSTIRSEGNYVPRIRDSWEKKLYSCDPFGHDLYDGYNGHDYGSDVPPHGVAMLIGERYLRKRYILLNLLNSQY